MPVVGFLNSASAEGYADMAAAFRDGLAQSGFRVGENVGIEYRWASDQYARLPEFAADLVARNVAVLFANSPAIAPAKAATSTTPIVFTSGDDPVRLGFVPNLNRPGGNVTGVAILAGELGAKRLQLLHELVPKAKTVAVLVNSDFGPSALRPASTPRSTQLSLRCPTPAPRPSSSGRVPSSTAGVASSWLWPTRRPSQPPTRPA
jgi:putative ABC transport system substrate-binding protein